MPEMQARFIIGVAIMAAVCCTAVFLNKEAFASEDVVMESMAEIHSNAGPGAQGPTFKSFLKDSPEPGTMVATGSGAGKASKALPGEASPGHLNGMVDKAYKKHSHAIHATNVAHEAATIAPFKVHAARVAAEAKELAKQAGIVKGKDAKARAAGSAGLKSAAAAVAKAAKVATATHEATIHQLHKIEHDKPPKQEAEQKHFIKEMKAVAAGQAPTYTDPSGHQYEPGHPGYIKNIGGGGSGSAGSRWPTHNEVAKEEDLYSQEELLFSKMSHRHTAEERSVREMRDAESDAYDSSTDLYKEMLKAPEPPKLPEEELAQALVDTIHRGSDDDERHGAQRVAYAAQETLFEEQMEPRRTEEEKAVQEMMDSEKVGFKRQEMLFQDTSQPFHTETQKAVAEMEDAEDTLVARQNAMFEDALTPVPVAVSPSEQRRAEAKAGYAAEQMLFDEMTQPQHTAEHRAVKEMKFADEVAQEEAEAIYEESLH